MPELDHVRILGTTYDIKDAQAQAIPAMLAPTEVTSTASAAHAAGSYFIYNGTLYEATEDIAVGGTITPGTNCKAATVGGEVTDLKSALDELAELKESDADDVDLDIADDDGNVIVRFADGHIQTKNFDSSAIDPEADVKYKVTNDDDSDLLIADTNGNVLVRFKDGNIQTKEFDSETVADSVENATHAIHNLDSVDYYKQFTYTGGTASTVNIEGDFKAGDTILCHYSNMADNRKDVTLNYKATYYYLDSERTQKSLGQDYPYNFARFILPEDASGIVAVFSASMFLSGTYTSRFLVYKLGKYERQPKIVTVAADGSKMFTSIRDAMESITDNNAYNTYEIWVYPGTYNIMEDYTDDEITAENFYGQFVNNGVTLVGIGHREQIVIHGELDPDDYDISVRNNISTLNTAGNCGIKNVTVTNKYLRYAVHDDFGSATYQEHTHIIENCKFESHDASSGGPGEVGYGAGGSSSKKLIIKDCDLGERLIIHNGRTMVVPMTAVVENSTVKIVTLTDNVAAPPDTRVEFKNCNIAVIRYMMLEDHAPSMVLQGEGTHNVMFDISSVVEHHILYNFGDCTKFPGTIAAGQAVAMDDQIQANATDDRDLIYGFSIGNDGENTLVQTGGYITSTTVGLTGLSVGDYVTIDTDGIMTDSGATSANAVGIVKAVSDYSGCAFIKLMI